MIPHPSDSKITPALLAVMQAIDALRRGQPVALEGEACTLLAVELLTHAQWQRCTSSPSQILLSGARARSLNVSAVADAVVLPAAGYDLSALQALADPTRANQPMLTQWQDDTIHAPLLSLAKQAGLLPALLVVEATLEDAVRIPLSRSATLQQLTSMPTVVEQAASARLPIRGAEHTRITSFRELGTGAVHLAVVVGEPTTSTTPPLVRVHSSCVTGDLLGSLRCDCGDQLALAMEAIKAEGAGILLYMNQEGRGIGITNKLRAYALQEQGIDTFEANVLLGFDEDERDFAAAASMLHTLGAPTVRLLTNNPEKLSALEHYGITIAERLPVVAPSGKHNHAYITAKGAKAGHLF
jgi:GTP cyclohydrolase II